MGWQTPMHLKKFEEASTARCKINSICFTVEVLGCSRLVFMSFQPCFVFYRMVLFGMVYGIQNVCGA